MEILALDASARPASKAAITQFPLKVPRPFVDRIARGDWDDPLLKQVWPDQQEEAISPDYKLDPLGENASNPVAGMLHKYRGRVLLTAAPHCGIHCRYCFRRHFDYHENTPGSKDWERVFDYIREDRSIEEVILSGGDPLAASDRQLRWLVSNIEAIPHVQTLRIHSRMPVVIPQRVDSELLEWLAATRLATVMVIHSNHANELDSHVAKAMNELKAIGVTLLNQAVFLRDVNDNAAVLTELSKKLFSLGVLPYYLHLLDKVQGSAHFESPDEKALMCIEEMRLLLPGYLVPKLVREQAGEGSKTSIR